MRIAISKRESYQADIYCSDGTRAKRALKENPISVLAIDYHLLGRENGARVLAWARTKNLLPSYVVITEGDRPKRVILANELTKAGFNTADGCTFIKH
jgi:hypothetical protein